MPVPKHVRQRPAALLYVAVDNVFEGRARLVVSRWPKRSSDGRELFGGSESVWVEVERLRAWLSRHRVIPTERNVPGIGRRNLREREVAPGDVFATPGLAEFADAPRSDDSYAEAWSRLAGNAEAMEAIEEWLHPPIIDLTAEMRDDAKLVFLAAVADTLTERQKRLLEADHGEGDASF